MESFEQETGAFSIFLFSLTLQVWLTPGRPSRRGGGEFKENETFPHWNELVAVLAVVVQIDQPKIRSFYQKSDGKRS
jgi:hypothetical protein